MSYNTDLQSNNAELREILDSVNELPDAGSGGVGQVAVEEKDVNFYDYDGTCLYAYTLAEAQTLKELPPLPSHEGLICQGWNWALEDVTALDQFMVIGANYITDDGKTRLYISLEYTQHLTVPLHIRQSVGNGVEIDWGDGSAVETISGTGEVNTSHTYTQLGEYVIKLNVTNGTLGLGASNSTSVVGANYSTVLRKVELGDGITSSDGIGKNAFYYCAWLDTITIPNEVTSPGSDCFSGCYSLRAVIFPSGLNTNTTYFLYNCASLKIVSFPKAMPFIPNSAVRECGSLKYVTLYRGSDSNQGVHNYGLQNAKSLRRFDLPTATEWLYTSAFNGCRSLKNFVVPINVTNIGATALKDCSGLVILRFLPTTPPTVANANAFTGIPATCVVEVPSESLDAYQNATNYGSLAAQMVGV